MLMVVRPLISNVSAFHKLLFVRPLVCSYPPLSYLKGLLLVQTFFLFTACCDYAFLLFPPSFYSYALFSFAPIPCFVSFLSLVSFRFYPYFLPLLSLISSRSYLCLLLFLSFVSLTSIRLLLSLCSLSLPHSLKLAVFI